MLGLLCLFLDCFWLMDAILDFTTQGNVAPVIQERATSFTLPPPSVSPSRMDGKIQSFIVFLLPVMQTVLRVCFRQSLASLLKSPAKSLGKYSNPPASNVSESRLGDTLPHQLLCPSVSSSVTTCHILQFTPKSPFTVGYGYKGWLGTGENCTIYPHYPL